MPKVVNYATCYPTASLQVPLARRRVRHEC